MRRAYALATSGMLVALIGMLSGCGGDATGPGAPSVIRMSVVSGNSQTGIVGTQLGVGRSPCSAPVAREAGQRSANAESDRHARRGDV
jgi:hypothetical protein